MIDTLKLTFHDPAAAEHGGATDHLNNSVIQGGPPGGDGLARQAAREHQLRARAEAQPCPSFAALTPPEAARQLRVLEHAAAARGDVRLAEALGLARALTLARPYLRHDPSCDHQRPEGVGATTCTCGLDAALRGRG